MKEYKGKFYKKITSKPHYLFGAHFDYYELYNKLLKLKNNSLEKNNSKKNINSNRIFIEAKNKNDINKIQLKKLKIVNFKIKSNNSYNDIFSIKPLTNKNIFNYNKNIIINQNFNRNNFAFDERIKNLYQPNKIFLSKTVDLLNKKNLKKCKSIKDISVFKKNISNIYDKNLIY